MLGWGKDQVCISTEGEYSQNEEMYPEKVEMVVDLTQEAIEALSLGYDRGVQRRHKGVLWSSECGERVGAQREPAWRLQAVEFCSRAQMKL